ncbi:MAG TPA: signal peptidase I [Candidatus Saccharimonadales bacterium]|nr:signal peptidase I [Candidatus Saccharimonadales bacterium]
MFKKLTARLSPRTRVALSYGIWVVVAIIMAVLLVNFVARSYSVHGISMEPTLRSGDLVMTSKVGNTWASLTGKEFVPARGALVVFKNPFYNQGDPDMFIVKRVIGLPGDRVVVSDGRIMAYPTSGVTPAGFDPDEGITGPQRPTSGDVDRIVPDGELFVAGDNRLGENSLDSRNGMSTVPLREIQGTVIVRFWPLGNWRFF